MDEFRPFIGIRDMSPCKDCTQRYPGCHGKCRQFAKWKNEVVRVNRARSDYGRKPFSMIK